MTLIVAPDCDCDAMDKIAHRPVKVSRYRTDADAAKRFLDLAARDLSSSEAVHGPSGHLLNMVP